MTQWLCKWFVRLLRVGIQGQALIVLERDKEKDKGIDLVIERDKRHQPIETVWVQGVLDVPSKEAEGFVMDSGKP